MIGWDMARLISRSSAIRIRPKGFPRRYTSPETSMLVSAVNPLHYRRRPCFRGGDYMSSVGIT
jgi:hypothetical protein